MRIYLVSSILSISLDPDMVSNLSEKEKHSINRSDL